MPMAGQQSVGRPTPHVLDPTRRTWVRDTSAVKYEDVSGTEAVKARAYVLHCSQLDRE